MREFRTAPIVANEVSMLRAAMKGPIVLVEGDTDTRLYRRFMIRAPYVRLTHCDGKPVMMEAMRLIEDRGIRGVIGICDSDFDRVIDRGARPDVVFADFHDAEMMIAYSDAFKHICDELYGVAMESSIFQSRRDSILEIASRIGLLRLWNEENRGLLGFRNMNPADFLRSNAFLYDDYLSSLIEASPGCSIDFRSAKAVISQARPGVDGGELACGHDFAALLDADAAMAAERDPYGVEIVEKMFRLGFDAVSFSKTNLVKSLQVWEARQDMDLLADEVLSLMVDTP
jgi:hypothetical protein